MLVMHRMLVPAVVLSLGLAAWPAVADGPKANPYYNPPRPKQGYSYPDCYCTDSTGGRVEMGQTACLTIGQRQVLARCDMSVNNPTWRYESVEEGCPGV
ncbi:MAG TPA: hypothetical protein VMM59_06350 [Thermohalobaculum sp.]|nr:hypothetical protein [Thermohalobaculum sp.]